MPKPFKAVYPQNASTTPTMAWGLPIGSGLFKILRMRADLDQKLLATAQVAVDGEAAFACRTPVIETCNGVVVWQGIVNEFIALDGRRVYAWAMESENGPQYMAVIQDPPVKSALDAVRAWLSFQARK